MEPPGWVQELVSSPLVREAHKYSKFIHGCAMLTPELVPSWPVWIREFSPDRKKDNLPHRNESKPHNNEFGIEMEEFGESNKVSVSSKTQYRAPSPGIFTKVRNFFDFDRRFPRLNDAESKMSKYTLFLHYINYFF